jgi:hypothetical protein
MVKKYNFLRNENFFTYLFIIIVIIYFLVLIIYTYSTQFEKIITIKKIDSIRSTKHGKNIVVDTNNNVYYIQNNIYLLFFNSIQLFSNLENNKTYKIKGYGFSYPNLGLYPNIFDTKEVFS